MLKSDIMKLGDSLMKKRIETRQDLVIEEMKRSYWYFQKEVNLKLESRGYGLVKDKSRREEKVASISATGFGLASLVIGVEHGWIEDITAYQRANRTLETFLNNVPGKNGFFYHFVDIETAQRVWNCEVSIIDTAIFLCGAILCAEYFKGEIQEKVELLYKAVQWNWYLEDSKQYFAMSYTPENGLTGAWDMYAEQLMVYILGISSPTFPVSEQLYDNFLKPKQERHYFFLSW